MNNFLEKNSDHRQSSRQQTLEKQILAEDQQPNGEFNTEKSLQPKPYRKGRQFG